MQRQLLRSIGYVILFLLIVEESDAQSTNSPEPWAPRVRVTIGGGVGQLHDNTALNRMATFGGDVTLQRDANIYVARYLYTTGGNRYHNYDEISLLFGRATTGSSTIASIAIGPSLLIPGDEVFPDPYFDAYVQTTPGPWPGIACSAHLLASYRFFGVGLGAYANINIDHPTYGVMLELAIGDVR